jgi:glycerophosphoryl diester phosphodiesterase
MKVRVWLANKPSQWDRLFRAGVDGIFTDRPAEAMARRAQRA